MKINKPNFDFEFYRLQKRELEYLLEQPTVEKMKPCPGCDIPCDCSGSKTCTCNCSSDCEEAPARMSSEPDRYPIETGIVPLVYKFYSLRVCTPCWSCEGHDSGVKKIPRVWFYSSSLAYPRLILDYINRLKHRKLLMYKWHITLTSPSGDLESAFSLEPNLNYNSNLRLDYLHKDIRTIADRFIENICFLAKTYIENINSNQPQDEKK